MFSNDDSNNPSTHASLQDIIETARQARRTFLKGSLGWATWMSFGGLGITTHVLARPADGMARPRRVATPVIGFESVPANTEPLRDAVTVPKGYTARVFVAWGDPIMPAANWDPATGMTEAQQSLGYGAHTDGMHFFPLGAGNRRAANHHGLLVSNSEYVDPGLLHNTGSYRGAPVTAAWVDAQLAAHGVNVVEAFSHPRRPGWSVRRASQYARRITGNTPMRISGPAAGSAMLRTPADPTGTRVLGTLGNCANGFTPWGTYLACEENFNSYFGTSDAAFSPTPHEKRYGLRADSYGYRWHEANTRFDLRAGGEASNEPNRFGWVVEIDPFDPKSTPVKRTALGRFKHEGAWVVTDDRGQVAVYMGDDERNEYVYKFVSALTWNPQRERRSDFLDHGTLYVARFDDDGRGVWLPLVWGTGGLTPENGFADQAEVLVKSRQAADRLGATMMDRPEWAAVHPQTREVYMTMTNNTRRGKLPASTHRADGSTAAGSAQPRIDAANPRPDNVYGHIVRWREAGNRVSATAFEWDLFVQAGDKATDKSLGTSHAPGEFGGQKLGYAGNISGDDFGAPDGLWFDRDGRLWIQTDQPGDGKGDWARVGSNMMLCANIGTGEVRRFLTAPPRAEVTGVTTTPDGRTMFVGIQHPGEGWKTSYTEHSAWPDNGANGPTTASARGPAKPRSAVVVITKDDGGVIGT